MFIQHVPSELLTSRVDADFYQPVYVEVENLIKKSMHDELQNISYFVRKGVFDMPSSLYCDEGVPFLRISDFDEQTINIAKSIKIPKWKHLEEYKTILKGGDLVLSKVGTTGKVAKVPTDSEVNISQNLVGISVKDDKVDSDYLLATFNCRHVSLSIERHVTTAVQGKLTLDILRTLVVPVFSPSVQTYIGNKVRQAELLKQYAKEIKYKLNSFFTEYEVEKNGGKDLVSNATSDLLTHILTATTYKQSYLKNQEKIKATGSIKRILDYLSSISNGFDERREVTDGLPYVKVADVRPSHINLSTCGQVKETALIEASVKQSPKKGDMLLTRKGSFGIAAVVMDSQKFLCSSEVFCCKPKNQEMMPILSWFLNLQAGQLQFWQFSTGTTMPGINQENLNNIIVPDFTTWDIDVFNHFYKIHHNSIYNAEKLTFTSKYLVEALIEGLISEKEVIAAQQALENDDNTKDKAILSKLSDKGYGVKDAKPLFSDLDEFYELLEEAQQDKDQD